MELVDAIAANTTARSPVELSLSPLFEREYSALYKGIQELSLTTQIDSTEADKSQKSQIEARLQAISPLIPTPQQKQFYLWALDVTPLPRPYAKTLEERTIIYQPNTIKGNKPINIGHSYSVLAALPEREETGDIPWERYLPPKTEGFLTPSLVQRDMNRIITEIGTPANFPKRRGFSSGRTEGMIQTKRTRHEVIKKGKKEKKLESSPRIAV